ncbi:MAG: hypothetical protein P8Z74_16395, partial [Acidobacteriota bacterium]
MSLLRRGNAQILSPDLIAPAVDEDRYFLNGLRMDRRIPTNGNPIAAGTAATPADPPGYGPVTDGTRVAGIPATVAPFEHR